MTDRFEMTIVLCVAAGVALAIVCGTIVGLTPQAKCASACGTFGVARTSSSECVCRGAE